MVRVGRDAVKPIVWLLAAGALALCLHCGEDANPFADEANARAVLLETSELSDADTVEIFATRSLVVGVLVPEQVESFTVTTQHNRLFDDTTIVSPDSRDYSFDISLFDTGTTTIAASTRRISGDVATVEWTVHAVSPLHQDDVTGDLDEDLLFSTPRVEDDVWYHWEYGDDNVLRRDTAHAPAWEVRERIGAVGSIPGRLFVSSDRACTTQVSPAVPFSIRIDDINGPEIICLNQESRDTIVTGAATFVFLAHVSDGGGVEQVTIDGGQIDPYVPLHYRSIYRGLDTAVSPLPVHVEARDLAGNTAERTFYIVHDSTVAGPQASQVIVDNVGDSALSPADTFLIIGRVRDYVHDTVLVAAHSSQGAVSDTLPVAMGGPEADFGLQVHLAEQVNGITICALDPSGHLLADTSVTVIRTGSSYVDSEPPEVLNVAVGTAPVASGNLIYLPDSSAVVTVQAFDASGIDSISINGEPMTARPGKPYEWTVTIGPIAYGTPTNEDLVVVDSEGNRRMYPFLVQKNRLPSLPPNWSWPPRFFAGTAYSIPFEVVDEEDNVVVSLEDEPAGMIVEPDSGLNRWVIRWTVMSDDTGSYLVTVNLADSLQTAPVQWAFRVLRDSTLLVRFENVADEIPRFLEVGRDTLDMQLQVAPGTGTPPFDWLSELTDRYQVLLDTSGSMRTCRLQWAPGAVDTGETHLAVSVADSYGDRDFLYRDITIVPRNADSCSLEWEVPTGTDTTGYGEIDMRAPAAPVPVTVRIIDSDHPYTESYVRTISSTGLMTTDTLDSAGTIVVVLDTVSDAIHDTLVVTVSDRTGAEAVVRVPVVYAFAMPAPSPSWTWPSRFVGGATYDIPFDVVADHAVTLGLSGAPGGLEAVATGDSEWAFRWTPAAADSGSFAATVTLNDGYQDTVMAWDFDVLPDSSRMLRFASGTAQVPGYAVYGEAIVCTLDVAAATGAPPLRYQVLRPALPPSLLDTVVDARSPAVLTWSPTALDSGTQHLLCVVSDSYGDADTLVRQIPVVPPNGAPVSLSFEYGAGVDTTAGGAVDRHSADAPDTIRFAITDDDHPLTEQYTVYITLGGLTSTEVLDAARSFEVTLDQTMRSGYDTLFVVVTDETGTSALAEIAVWYGLSFGGEGGAALEVDLGAGPADVVTVTQGDTDYVNTWQNQLSLLPFASNTFGGGAPPVLDTTGAFRAISFSRAAGSNLLSNMSRNTWAWLDSAFTLVVVARADSVAAETNYALVSACDSDAGYMAFGVVDGAAGVFSSAGQDKSTAAVQAGEWSVFTFSCDVGRQANTLGARVWVNGVPGGGVGMSESFVGYHTMAGAVLRLRADNGWEGDVARMLLYRGMLSDTERSQVESFLADAYGIPLP